MIGLPPTFDLTLFVSNNIVVMLSIVQISLVLFSLRLILKVLKKVTF